MNKILQEIERAMKKWLPLLIIPLIILGVRYGTRDDKDLFVFNTFFLWPYFLFDGGLLSWFAEILYILVFVSGVYFTYRKLKKNEASQIERPKLFSYQGKLLYIIVWGVGYMLLPLFLLGIGAVAPNFFSGSLLNILVFLSPPALYSLLSYGFSGTELSAVAVISIFLVHIIYSFIAGNVLRIIWEFINKKRKITKE